MRPNANSPRRRLLVVLAVGILTTPLGRLGALEAPEESVDPGPTYEEDFDADDGHTSVGHDFDADDCDRLPDPPGRAHGIRRRCGTPSSAGATGADFDGDGRRDLVVGVPFENVGSRTDAGTVNVLLRTASGFSGSVLSQNSTNVADTSEADDRFGAAVAPGDFNGDGLSDLAVAIPGEISAITGDTRTATGAIQVFLSQPLVKGSTGDRSILGSGINRFINGGSLRGADGTIPTLLDSLAFGDFDCDGIQDLAAEARVGANVGVIVLFGGAASATRSDGIDPNVRQLRLFPNFSSLSVVLAVGNFDSDADHCDDLALGAPGEQDGEGGEVAVALGVRDRSRTLTSVTTAVATDHECGGSDRFGAALGAGDVDGDGFDDLVVGEPGSCESISGNLIVDAGAVRLFFGTPSGVDFNPDHARLLTQGGSGGGEKEPRDHFGEAVAIGFFDGDTIEDMAVGVPFEDIDDKVDAGAVNIFYGAFDRGFRKEVWSQDSVQGGVAVKGLAEAGDHFGATLSGWGRRLTVGVPLERVTGSSGGTLADAGAVNVLLGGGSGLTAEGNELYTQGTLFGTAENGTGDQFGLVVY